MSFSMRRLSTLLVGGFLASSFLGGCLPKYNGTAAPEDMADVPNDPSDPPTGPASTAAGPEDLAGSVVIDAFTTTGTALIVPASNAATLRLNESQDITLTITGNGQSGSATLALMNAPTGLTATFNPATVTLGATPATVVMSVKAASDMDPATSVATNIQLTDGTNTSTATFGVTVTTELLITIANGVDTTTKNTTAFGAASVPIKVKSGVTKVTFVNEDGIEHRIHADGTDGLQHEPNNMGANGGTYSQTLTNTVIGAVNFHCHIHTNMMGQLMVE